MNSRLNKLVALNIVKAQVASDGGKGIVSLRNFLSNVDNKYLWHTVYSKGYYGKDFYILKAIEYIRTHVDCGFRFYVKDLGSNASIVYFWYKVEDGTRCQISFHSFSGRVNRYSDNDFSTNWDHKCSQDNCLYLFMEVFKGGLSKCK